MKAVGYTIFQPIRKKNAFCKGKGRGIQEKGHDCRCIYKTTCTYKMTPPLVWIRAPEWSNRVVHWVRAFRIHNPATRASPRQLRREAQGPLPPWTFCYVCSSSWGQARVGQPQQQRNSSDIWQRASIGLAYPSSVKDSTGAWVSFMGFFALLFDHRRTSQGSNQGEQPRKDGVLRKVLAITVFRQQSLEYHEKRETIWRKEAVKRSPVLLVFFVFLFALFGLLLSRHLLGRRRSIRGWAWRVSVGAVRLRGPSNQETYDRSDNTNRV